MKPEELKKGQVYKDVFPHKQDSVISPVLFLGEEKHPDYDKIYCFTRLDQYDKNKPMWDIFKTEQDLIYIR